MVSPAAVVPVKIIAFLQRRFCEAAFFFDDSMPRGWLAPLVYKSNCGIVGTLRPSAASTPNPPSRAAAGDSWSSSLPHEAWGGWHVESEANNMTGGGASSNKH